MEAPDFVLPTQPEIRLQDHECFHDHDGNPLHIDVRGRREHGSIYFRVVDIHDLILGESVDEDDIFFAGNWMTNKYVVKMSRDCSSSQLYYYTYKGLLKFAFTRGCLKKGVTDLIVDWAINTVHHLTTGEGNNDSCNSDAQLQMLLEIEGMKRQHAEKALEEQRSMTQALVDAQKARVDEARLDVMFMQKLLLQDDKQKRLV